MTKTHLLYTPFLGLGCVNRGDAWLSRRIEIFKHYVLNALCNQSNLHFTLWVSWRPEDEFNPIVQDFYRHLNQVRAMSPVFTYNGLCFYDDKYTDDEAKARLRSNLEATLPYLRQHTEEFDEVLVTIQPSDDMYLFKAVEMIQNAEFERACGFTKGYIIDYGTKQIANYDPDTTPPFYTLKFTKEEFLDTQKHYDIIKNIKSHEYVRDIKGFKELEGRMFVIGIHSNNISTTWDTYRGRILTDKERDDVLLKTGTFFTEPIRYKQNGRLMLRRIYNLLPAFIKRIIKKIYYKYV